MHIWMSVVAIFLSASAGLASATAITEHRFASGQYIVAVSEARDIFNVAVATLSRRPATGGHYSRAGAEVAQGPSSSRPINHSADAKPRRSFDASAPVSDCVDIFAKDCIEAILYWARQETERIGDPSVPGEKDLVANIHDAIVTAREASQRTDGSWTADFLATASVEGLLAVSRASILAAVARAYVDVGSKEKGNRLVPLIIEEWNAFVSADIAQFDDDFNLLRYVADRQAELGFFEDALRTVEHIRADEERAWPLQSIAEAQAEAGLTAQALETARKIGVPNEKASAYASIAEAQAKAGDLNEARRIVELIDDDYLKAQALLSLAVAKPELMPFVESIRAAEKLDDKETRERLFSDIAVVQVQVGRFEEGLATLQRVHDQSLKGRAQFRIAAVQARTGHTAEALRSYDAAGKLAGHLDESHRMSLRWKVIAELIKVGSFQDAIAAAQQCDTSGQRAWALAAIARAQADADLIDEALTTASLIATSPAEAKAPDAVHGTVVSPGEKASVLAGIGQAQAASGNRAATRKTFKAAVSAAEALGETGSYSFGTSRGERLRVIVQAQAQSGLFEDALGTALLIDEEPSRSKAFRDLAKEEAAAGLFDEALSVVRQIVSGTAKSEALREIANAQVKVGLREKARETLLAARQSAQSDTGAWDYRCELLAIATTQADLAFTNDARRTFALAKRIASEAQDEPDDADSVLDPLFCRGRFQFLGTDLAHVVGAQAKAGLLDDALQTVGHMKFASMRACFLIAVAQGLAAH